MKVLLGIDVGTSSTKGVLADEAGIVVATAVRPHVTSMPRPGWVEHDAESIWWQDVCAVSKELLTAPDVEVVGVCVSGIGPCLLVADQAGRPLRPAILYGVDTRAEAEIVELTERLGAESILARGGSALTTQAVGPKLLWLARHEPAVFAESRRLFMASSYALWRLTGEYVLDHHSASQCDPMYDLLAGDWAGDWARELAGPIELPSLRWPGEVAGLVTAEGAAETGIPVDTPVATGTIDAWSEAVSAGVRDPGEAMVMYGTTMFFVAVCERPLVDRRLWSTAGAFNGTWTLAGGMAASGSVVAWGASSPASTTHSSWLKPPQCPRAPEGCWSCRTSPANGRRCSMPRLAARSMASPFATAGRTFSGRSSRPPHMAPVTTSRPLRMPAPALSEWWQSEAARPASSGPRSFRM